MNNGFIILLTFPSLILHIIILSFWWDVFKGLQDYNSLRPLPPSLILILQDLVFTSRD